MKSKQIGLLVIAGVLIGSISFPAVRGQGNSNRMWSDRRTAPADGSTTLASSPAEPAAPRVLSREDVLMPSDPILIKISQHQERSQREYKSMTFEQKVIVERYKPRAKLQEKDQVTQHREIVARYSPDGHGELGASLVSDSDKKGSQSGGKKASKKEKGGEKGTDKKDQSLAQKLISPLLFPMTTENVQKCKFTVLLALPEVMLLRFEPEAMNLDPIFSGQVLISPETGEIYRLEIDALYNFEKIDGRFKHLQQFAVAIEYTKQADEFRFPTYMHGRGFAKVLWIKGDFRFDITESGYTKPSSEPVTEGVRLTPVITSSACRPEFQTVPRNTPGSRGVRA